jgi:hypothetical protein
MERAFCGEVESFFETFKHKNGKKIVEKPNEKNVREKKTETFFFSLQHEH